jgi:hypothetical protein
MTTAFGNCQFIRFMKENFLSLIDIPVETQQWNNKFATKRPLTFL